MHVFPDRLAEAVRRWFDEHGWPVRYRLTSDEIIDYLLGRGVSRLVLLHYAHQSGMARKLNEYAASLQRRQSRVSALATVCPGEPGAQEILAEGFKLGLGGVKLHQHVQCFEIDGEAVREICESCIDHDKPLIAHFGREPKSPSYRCDPHEFCSADRVEVLLKAYPELKLCVPHMGADEFEEYLELTRRYDNLWLDTTMMLAGYFPGLATVDLTRYPADRVIYGTDFCNLPFAWDRELKIIAGMNLSDDRLEKLLSLNAREFYSLPED